MNVMTTEDCTDVFPNLFKGSVIQEVEEREESYHGLFCSSFGSYYVTIFKKM